MMTQKEKMQARRYRYLDDIPAPVLIASGRDLVVEYANRKASVLLEKHSGNLTGKSVHVIFPTIFSSKVVKEIYGSTVLEGTGHLLNERQIILPGTGQKLLWYNIDISPIRDGEGRSTGVILLFSDVTAQVFSRNQSEERLTEFTRRLELEVQQRTSELSKTNDLLVTNIAQVNHTQALLQQLIDSSIEYIGVVDMDLKFLIVNKPVEKVMNRSRADLVGKHVLEVYEGARGSGQVEALRRALAGEVVHLRVNPSISRPNVWFDTHCVPLMITGRIEGAIILSRDISEIVQSEKELANVNRQLAEAQRLAKLGSWEWDVATGNVLWSDEMYRIYGYEKKIPMDFVRATERMSPEDAETSSKRTQQHIQMATDQFKRNGQLVFETTAIEFAIKLPNGVQKVVRNSGRIQLTPEGKLHRILGIVQDVTRIRSTEEQLRLSVSELERKNKELESFNYVASHDLQEPLRKIRTFIDRILNGPMDRKGMDDYLLRINNSARRMHDLIQSMLTLSRLSSSTDGFTEVDLNIILRNCKSDLELVIKETHATIESDVLPVVVASEFQMTQMFGNLVNNALKFSHENPRLQITCKKVMGDDIQQRNADVKTAYWCLSFTDNGIGFDSKYKDQIFALFQRLHPEHQFAGTGIGLSIVKQIVERHQGFIDASSEPGKGSCFCVWLPCRQN
jgi:PAS domain S-box-containing protein